jgi:hypothetical protein
VKRRAVWLAVSALLAACTTSSGAEPTSTATGPASRVGSPPPVVSTRALAQQVCAGVSHEVLLRTWRGYFPGRSGDLQIIPTYPNFVNGGLTHATPYPYTQDVPVFLYGRGYVRPGTYSRAITLADLAPTAGALLKFPFHAPDGTAQTQALLPTDARPVPRLLVTMVWDSAGWDVLDRWKDDWPYLRSLLPQGALFTNATVGSSPSNTPTGHSTIGTGAFPMHTGFVDEYLRVNGTIQKPNAAGPAFLLEPTLADLFDRAMGNRPIVGGLASLSAHIMMMSHGSEWGGGDRDIAVTREVGFGPTGGAESNVWNLTTEMAPFYRFPNYVKSLPPVTAYTRTLDQADGKLDGAWRGHPFSELHDGFDTPARTPYQETLIETVIQREGFGQDDVPDLLYLNYKAIDTIGHLFSADSLEMSDAVMYQDEALRRLVGFLNRVVGRGDWVLMLTSDHGTQRDPTVSGAFMIDIGKLTSLIEQAFDRDGDGVPLIQRVRATEIWFDPAELKDNGVTLSQISQFIMDLTQEQTYKNLNPPAPGHEQDPVFAAAFPSSMLSKLPCLPEARAGAS